MPNAPRRQLHTAGGRLRTVVVGVAVVAAGLAAVPASLAAASDADDWLTVVNTYRSMSGLDPVAENGSWSTQARAHSCYMLDHGMTHDETPGRPGYTEGGDTAGNSSNIAVSSNIDATARQHVDLWMTGPFHAIAILRHNLGTSGFGTCADGDTPTPWSSAATLDISRGVEHGADRPSTPIVFPGRDATIPLHSFIAEFPDPVSICGWTGAAGLPLVAMMTSTVSSASASVTGPDGPIETCVLHRGNTTSTAQSILSGENAVVVVPRKPLADATYTASVTSNGGNTTWSFTIDRDAELGGGSAPSGLPVPDMPDTAPIAAPARFEPTAPFRHVDSREQRGTNRLRGRKVTRIAVGDANTDAVSANFVAVDPSDFGFVTAFNCTAARPEVSTLGFRPGDVVANQAVVPLDHGDLCLYASTDTDIIIDINGYFRSNGTSGFNPTAPERVMDTRDTTALHPKQQRRLRVAGGSAAAPGDATSVSLNVTVTGPDAAGWLQVYPCGAPTEISTINYEAGAHRPNSVVVPVDATGHICFRSLRESHVIADYTGYFSGERGHEFTPLNPIRLFDSRVVTSAMNRETAGRRLHAGQTIRIPVAGERGVPGSAKAVSVNVTAVDATAGSFLTVFPCGRQPETSNVNIVPDQAVSANGAMVKLSEGGDLCVYTLNPVHVIVDISGIYG